MACYALHEFAREHRPQHEPFPGPAGVLLVVIYARASKSFEASLLLASDGYGPQARMINRSLFEDMATGHWVKRNPDAALPQLEKHGRYTMNRYREFLAKYDKLPAESTLPVLTPKENKKLREEFRGGATWTGLNMNQLVRAVEDEWTHPLDKRLLGQQHDWILEGDKLLLHSTGTALASAWRVAGDIRRMEVGPSPRHVAPALAGAFFAYAHTMSLVINPNEGAETNAALNALYSEHVNAFVTVSYAEPMENDVESSADEQSLTNEAALPDERPSNAGSPT